MKWSALLVLCAATFGVDTEAKTVGQFRSRRLIRAHGQWCGPDWTGGRAISARQYMREGRSFSAYCIDEADCACRQHDYDCAIHDGCCKEDDDKLINALQGTDSPFLIAAMKAARVFHKSCSKSSSWWDEDDDIQKAQETNVDRSGMSNLFADEDEDVLGFGGGACCRAMSPECLACQARNNPMRMGKLRDNRQDDHDDDEPWFFRDEDEDEPWFDTSLYK